MCDIVVDDIGQPQCHNCTKKQKKKLVKEREKKTTCDIVVDQCHLSAILLDNFPFHTHMMYLSPLFIFLPRLFLTNNKREKQCCHKSCHQIVVQTSLPNSLTT